MAIINLTAPNADIQYNRGDNLQFTVTVNSSTITDLAGWDFLFLVETKTGVLILEASTADFISLIAPLIVKVNVPPDELKNIDDYGLHLFRAISPDESKRTWFCGKLTPKVCCSEIVDGEGNGLTVTIEEYNITLDFDAGMSGPAGDVAGYFATLFATPYLNDTEARGAGLVTGDPYVFALLTDVGIAYTLKFVQPII